MANNVKYQFDFFSNDGTQYEAKIRKKGYGGSSTVVKTESSPIIITWEEVETWWAPIHASSCRIRLNSSTNFEFDEFFDAAIEDYQIEITNKVSSAVIWIGYNEPGLYNEPYVDAPYYIELSFTDGLVNLKNHEFKDGANPFDGQMHVIEILRHCLNTIGSDYAAGPKNIVEIINIYENDMPLSGVAFSPLVQLFTATSSYRIIKEHTEEFMTKYDVIAALMKSLGSFIVQAGGLWYLIRAKEFKESELTFRTFTPHVGTEDNTLTASNGTISHTINHVGASSLTSSTVVMLEQTGVLGLRARIGRAAIQYRPNNYYYINGSLIRNSDFYADYGVDSDDDLPKFFDRSAGLTTSNARAVNIITKHRRVVGQDPDTGIGFSITKTTSELVTTPSGASVHGDFYIRFDNSLSAIDVSKYVKSQVDRVFVSSSDKIMPFWSFKLITYGSTIVITPIKIVLTDLSVPTSYYLNWDGTWTTTDNGWLQFNNYPRNDKFLEAGHKSQSLPFTGEAKVEFFMLMPWIEAGQGDKMYFNLLAMNYLVGGGASTIDERIYVKEIDTLHNSYEIETKHGDGPDYVSAGSFRLATKVPTDSWQIFAGGEDLGIHEIILDDVLSLLNQQNKTWRGTIQSGGDEIWPYNKIHYEETIPPATTREFDFVPLGMTYDLQNRTYEVSMGEIDENAYSSVDIDTGTPAGEVPAEKVRGEGGGGTPQGQTYAPTGRAKSVDENTNFPG